MEENKKKTLLSRVIEEYKKVTWADRPTVFQVTVIVLLITAFVSLMVVLFDFSFKYVLDTISELLGKVLGK
ncbi:preprotein translocase subunit SecE [Oceanivirga salmonicida]|uniref:preprotein translocase subunit SecE n=1 Tax=Oceanivirga salmonicida TaxID=1769291 RepID=UPI00083310C1|nr:preprotein translocase subunit SecE [Oceanivirga salmonicida]